MSLHEDKETNTIKGTLWVRSADVTQVLKGKRTKLTMFTMITGNINFYKGCEVEIKLPEPVVNMTYNELHLKVKGGNFTMGERKIMNKFIDYLKDKKDVLNKS